MMTATTTKTAPLMSRSAPSIDLTKAIQESAPTKFKVTL